jgi:hypothetical protein
LELSPAWPVLCGAVSSQGCEIGGKNPKVVNRLFIAAEERQSKLAEVTMRAESQVASRYHDTDPEWERVAVQWNVRETPAMEPAKEPGGKRRRRGRRAGVWRAAGCSQPRQRQPRSNVIDRRPVLAIQQGSLAGSLGDYTSPADREWRMLRVADATRQSRLPLLEQCAPFPNALPYSMAVRRLASNNTIPMLALSRNAAKDPSRRPFDLPFFPELRIQT